MRHLASSHASRSRPLMLAVLALLFQHLVADVKADAIDRYIRDEMDRQKIPGLALAVVKHGKLKKARGYGLSNVEHSIPVKPHTVFQSGSIAKQYKLEFAAAPFVINPSAERNLIPLVCIHILDIDKRHIHSLFNRDSKLVIPNLEFKMS